MTKNKKNLVVIGLILLFLVCGYTIFLYGLKNGESLAINLSMPEGAKFWSTSKVQKDLTMYGICGFGALWVIVSHILFILLITKNFISSKCLVDKK